MTEYFSVEFVVHVVNVLAQTLLSMVFVKPLVLVALIMMSVYIKLVVSKRIVIFVILPPSLLSIRNYVSFVSWVYNQCFCCHSGWKTVCLKYTVKDYTCEWTFSMKFYKYYSLQVMQMNYNLLLILWTKLSISWIV